LRAVEIFNRLHERHPDAHCELNFSNSLELLFATILSAQCTDVRVNEVTKTLFKRCKTLSDYLSIEQGELEEIIHSAGFYKNKAKNILAAARMIHEQFGGAVPAEMEHLVNLPGVGRKTANVVLGNAFSIPGLPVDTHVSRVSERLGLTKFEDPVKIEEDLCNLLKPEQWTMFSHLLIFHGRRTCKARTPLCQSCNLSELCGYFKKGTRKTVVTGLKDKPKKRKA
jgi:endonuclease-3